MGGHAELLDLERPAGLLGREHRRTVGAAGSAERAGGEDVLRRLLWRSSGCV